MRDNFMKAILENADKNGSELEILEDVLRYVSGQGLKQICTTFNINVPFTMPSWVSNYSGKKLSFAIRWASNYNGWHVKCDDLQREELNYIENALSELNLDGRADNGEDPTIDLLIQLFGKGNFELDYDEDTTST